MNNLLNIKINNYDLNKNKNGYLKKTSIHYIIDVEVIKGFVTSDDCRSRKAILLHQAILSCRRG